MTKKKYERIKNDLEFQQIIQEIVTNETVQKMNDFRQHANTSCYEHCLRVSYDCYKIAKKLKLDYHSIARASMLHDLFLYDWREKTVPRRWHAFTHAKIACDNASRLFDLNEREKDMILRHMWPTTLIPPKTLEGFILSIVDKHCAFMETLEYDFECLLHKKTA